MINTTISVKLPLGQYRGKTGRLNPESVESIRSAPYRVKMCSELRRKSKNRAEMTRSGLKTE